MLDPLPRLFYLKNKVIMTHMVSRLKWRLHIPMMTLFKFFPFLCLSFALFASGTDNVSAESNSARPNIIFILADDMGYGDVSALNPEGKIQTPQLDRLAAEGIYFTDMHTPSSVCTPTRYGLLTGRYSWRSALKSGVLGGYSRPLIEPKRLTLASMLKESGYHTAVIGKWHLGIDWTENADGPKKAPNARDYQEQNIDFSRPFTNGLLAYGFDYFFGISASLDMPPYVYLENDRASEVPTTRKQWVREGAAAESFEAVDVLPKTTEKAIEYIESRAEAVKQGTPFFLYFPLTSPHTPILPVEPWKGASGINSYADFVMQTDDTVGQIVKKVDELGLGENTIIIFTADNGCSPAANINQLIEHGHYPNGIFRGHKADIFDGGHRVPFLVRWTAKIEPGTHSDQLACLTDMMRTFSDIIGTTLPDTAGEDSVSMLPALLGTASEPLRTEVIHHSINGSFAIRQGEWKLALCPDSGGWSDPRPNSPGVENLPPHQLYNMQSDVRETSNLQAEHSRQVEQMMEALQEIVDNGRSTPGEPQQNNGTVTIQRRAAP